ncbi:MAG: metallophosphoesterase [Defluviitaleaceae bacterium]|nr:metallophosphoesterase [Defluviitaleaceae bacterium]
MRFLVNFILRIGIIELFLLFFVLVNVAAAFLYVYTKKERLLYLFTLACGGIGTCLGMLFTKSKPKSRALKIITAIGLVIAVIPIVHIAHGLTLDRIIRYIEIEFTAENWPAELDGYRIAFMTDMHTISDETMRAVASELNQRSIDLLVLGGDFTTRDSHYQGTLREIANVVTTDGIFGVEGNHDCYIRLFYAMAQHEITPLDNSGVHVRDGFYLAGVHDMWNRSPDIAEAIAGAYPGDFVLLISHNPDIAMVQPMDGVDLMLSGHTHNGQITFFGFPMYLFRGSITAYGARFAYGFSYSADGTPVFVSKGIGPYYTIPRIFARPEVVIFTMVRG